MSFPNMETSDFFNLNGFKKNAIENVTSHKIAVVIFIREFCALKKITQDMMIFEYPMSPKYRRDFCILVLKLIQPNIINAKILKYGHNQCDVVLIKKSRYFNITTSIFGIFLSFILFVSTSIYWSQIFHFPTLIKLLLSIRIPTSIVSCGALKNDRWRLRCIINFNALKCDKLPLPSQSPDLEFSELEGLLTSGKYNLLSTHLQNFCHSLKKIYDEGVNALIDNMSQIMDKLMMDDASDANVYISKSSVAGIFIRKMMVFLEKLSFSQVTSVYRCFCSYYESGRPGSLMRCLSKDKLNSPDCDFPLSIEGKRVLEKSRKYVFDKDSGFEHCQWSRKQAELLTARQATLLQGGEPRALSPPTLQKTIAKILKDNPDYAEAHFLSYMNCLRSREFCGAMDSLYSCFDHTISTPSQGTLERNKVFRYASLNLAILHALFGHKDQVMSALKEAMVMSQEAGDGACLQQAACWAWWIGHSLPPTAPRHHPHPPHTRHRAAMQAQVFVHHNIAKKKTPALLFNFMMKADIFHCQNSLTDLMQTCIANRAALWAYYGKTEMAFLSCQLLLNLNTGGEWDSESSCLAACGLAQVLAASGQKLQAASVLQHARARAPNEPHCRIWMRTQYLISASYALMSGKWQEVEQITQQLSSIDRWESQLIKAELHFLKGESVYALKCLNDILNNGKFAEDNKLCLPLQIKAMILTAQIENSSSGIYGASSSNIIILNEALTLAKENYLDYLAAIIEMHIANVQLQLGCVTNALTIVQRILSKIMAHGGLFDQGRAMLLYIKCRIASAPKSGEVRKKTMTLCSDLLESVKKYFNKVEAISRLKDVIYLQAQVYNEIGNIHERNKCALEYRQIDEEHPTKLTNALLTCF